VTLRPGRLRPGDLVALVAPSGPVPHDQAAAAARILTGWGLRSRLGRNALAGRRFLAGTDDERLADLDDALRDPEVRGVLCLRGGYGAQRIVDRIDYPAVRADPKLVLGYSDITALHLALWCETGLATVHGPMGSALDASAQWALMTGEPVTLSAEDGLRVPGRAQGVLLGGNLTLLATSVGTRHQPDLTGAILLLEDVDEAPYRIDRSLTQLRRAGWLDAVAGIALGRFTNCVDDKPGPSAEEVLAERLASLGVPLLGGLPVGHGGPQTAVALGVPAVLDAGRGTLTVEAAS
jgi:muramoyltetrapeptide carboxypeptidase